MAKELDENQEALEEEKVEEASSNEKETGEVRQEVEEKIKRQIAKKQEKQEKMGVYRIIDYMKEEHKWENYLFVGISIIIMVMGGMILSGALVVRNDFPVIGPNPTLFAWLLLGVGFLALIYSLYPFYKPCFPEFKKITWPTLNKFVADSIRVFLFIIIFVLLFLLYDFVIRGALRYIFK